MKYKQRPTIQQRTKLYELIKEFAIKNDYNLSIIKNNKMNTNNNNKNQNLKGVLFINNNKKTDNHPDFTGNITINNRDFYLNGWKNKSKNEVNYISVSIGEEIIKETENKKDDLFI